MKARPRSSAHPKGCSRRRGKVKGSPAPASLDEPITQKKGIAMFKKSVSQIVGSVKQFWHKSPSPEHPVQAQHLSLFEALDKSLKYGLYAVDWSGVR